jgi:transposase
MGESAPLKATVLGMAQRSAKGRDRKTIMAKVIPDATRASILPHVAEKVFPSSMIFTDEASVYDRLHMSGYHHRRVNHSAKVYVSGEAHTNTIEGFWSLLKRGIAGVYHGVSEKHLQSYIDEYVFRYNQLGAEGGMFSAFLGRIEQVSPEADA